MKAKSNFLNYINSEKEQRKEVLKSSLNQEKNKEKAPAKPRRNNSHRRDAPQKPRA